MAVVAVNSATSGLSWVVTSHFDTVEVAEYELDPDDMSEPTDDRLARDGFYRGDCTGTTTFPVADLPALVAAMVQAVTS